MANEDYGLAPLTEHEIDMILLENDMRTRLWKTDYDPIRGIGCYGNRVRVSTPYEGEEDVWVPADWTSRPLNDYVAWQRNRCKVDFEYWCAKCIRIKHKAGGEVPLVLNAPQRRLLAELENQRLAERPIRAILLKARQWGGSTVIQAYMAWIQSCQKTDWHSLICAHVKDTAGTIRGMYTKMLDHYPEHLWEGEVAPKFKPFERSVNVREISGRGCRVTLGTAESPDSIRGADYAMAHLSEAAFWKSTPTHTPEDFIRAISGSVMLMPYTLVVVESTANGVGNYFHSEWMRSCKGLSDKQPVFVPWYEIEFYRIEPPDARAFVEEFDSTERELWKMGLALNQIYWYHLKRREYGTPELICAEFPSTDTEAFLNSGSAVFDLSNVDDLRADCYAPVTGAVTSQGEFVADRTGRFALWKKPRADCDYVVAVDIGGRSLNSDWSVIAVLGFASDRPPEVVGQWRGHIDHDLLASEAERIARWYNNALLVVESNSLETSGDFGLFILNRLARNYPRLYRRRVEDVAGAPVTTRLGFHTNRSTKSMIISGLIEAVREGTYVEHDEEACNEMATYEQQPSGAFAAKDGHHDDILMTRAIALHVAKACNIGCRGKVPVSVWSKSTW